MARPSAFAIIVPNSYNLRLKNTNFIRSLRSLIRGVFSRIGLTISKKIKN
jgi:hypothetical protein